MPTDTLLSPPQQQSTEQPPIEKSTQLPQFMAGDVVLFAARGDLYGIVGRWIMRTRGEGPTYAVHTAQFLDAGRYIELDLVGKIKPTEQILKAHQSHDIWKRRGFEVWRSTSLDDEQRQAVTDKALIYVGAWFGWAKFVTHFLDGLIDKLMGKEVFFFRRLNHDQRYPICSWITSFSYDRAIHYQFGVPPECADPDEIADWLTSHPDEWQCVFHLEDYST